jgi:hypothetical protein
MAQADRAMYEQKRKRSGSCENEGQAEPVESCDGTPAVAKNS